MTERIVNHIRVEISKDDLARVARGETVEIIPAPGPGRFLVLDHFDQLTGTMVFHEMEIILDS